MNEAMTTVPADHPMKRAWDAYKATEAYANSLKWALLQESADHVVGSLWAAFTQGYAAAAPAPAPAAVSTHGCLDEAAQMLEAHGCRKTARCVRDAKAVIPNVPVSPPMPPLVAGDLAKQREIHDRAVAAWPFPSGRRP